MSIKIGQSHSYVAQKKNIINNANTQINNNISFTASPNVSKSVDTLAREFIEVIKKSNIIPKGFKIGKYEKHINPEIAQIGIASLGTAAIAPFMIAFNPFSDKDKQTKAYSAWRQPLSAFITLAAQLGSNIAYQKFLDKRADNGLLGPKYNLKQFKNKKYLVSSENEIIKNLQNKKKHKGKTEDQLINIINIKKERQAFKFSTKIQKLGPKAVINGGFAQEFVNKPTIDRFKETTEGFINDFNKNADELLVIKRNKYTKYFTNIKTKQAYKELSKFIDKGYMDLEKAFGDEAKLFNELTPDALKKIHNMKKELAKKLTNLPEKEAKEFVETHLHKKCLERMKDGSVKMLKNEKLMAKTLKTKFLNRLLYLDAEDSKKMIEELFINKKINIKSNLNQFKTTQGIIISLITLPITCGFLNWVYPRFMEKFLPHLALSNKGGAK